MLWLMAHPTKKIAAGLAVVVVVFAAARGASAESAQGTRRVYSHLLEPRAHPDYSRRAVRPPDWQTFGGRTHFTCLRGFEVKDGRITGYAEEIEKFTRRHDLGDFIWPSYPILFATNLAEFAEEVKGRGLFLFDIWGYVPGSGPGGYWQQFKPPPEGLALLESTLGERWLGTDIGEQDGRYVGGYAGQMTPSSAGRFEQYLNFQRHFERMGDDLGHKHATLVSLNFGHYLLKEGTYTLIGAETAQALPNNEVYYAFIRGAGKQYGVPWFGNASVYNRWGYKTYGASGGSGGDTHGPTKGTSLSLMKRLLYSHILYNSVAVGFENGWFEGAQLSPIGRIQQSAQRWIRANGQPGVMHTPVALLIDFYSGWTFPRHLYSGEVYRVWGNLPYGPGDYLTDALLDLIYPGYQDSSYYRDESGFIVRTPYGDIADCLLSDAPAWVLRRYPVVVVAGELSGGRELRDKLQAYVEDGGHLVITTANLARLPGGVGGQTAEKWNVTTVCGKGRVTVIGEEYGLELTAPEGVPLRSEVDKPLPKGCQLSLAARQRLDVILREQMLFEVGNPELSYVTCRKSPGEYTVGIFNNTWREQPFRIESRCGTVEALRELAIDESEKSAVGYTPESVNVAGLGRNSDVTIAGGDVRVFAVRVREAGVEEIADVVPPARPVGRILPLRSPRPIKEEILWRPTFFEHFDSVSVDWRYVHDRESAVLEREARWIQRQGLRVWVDLSSGIDLYPTLRLVNNLEADYHASMSAIDDVVRKMQRLGAHDLILSLHRQPENNFDGQQTRSSFVATLQALAGKASERQIKVHLRCAASKPPWTLAEAGKLLDDVGAANLYLAPSTALLEGTDPTAELKKIKDRIGLWLLAGSRKDAGGHRWDAHFPFSRAGDAAALLRWLNLAPSAPVLLDAVYADPDEEYLDAASLARWSASR